MIFSALIGYDNVYVYVVGNRFHIVRLVKRIDDTHYKTLQVVEVFMKKTSERLEHYYKFHKAGWNGYGDVVLEGYDDKDSDAYNRCVVFTQGTGDDAKKHYFMYLREFNCFRSLQGYAQETRRTERELRHDGYLKEGEVFRAFSDIQIAHGILFGVSTICAVAVSVVVAIVAVAIIGFLLSNFFGFITYIFQDKLSLPSALSKVLGFVTSVAILYRIYKSWDYGWLCDLRENLGWKKIE